jgi:hypothetical protein
MIASTLATSESVVREQHPEDLSHNTSADTGDYWFYTSEGYVLVRYPHPGVTQRVAFPESTLEMDETCF